MYFHANSTLADSSATGTDAVAIGGNAQVGNDGELGGTGLELGGELGDAGDGRLHAGWWHGDRRSRGSGR